MSSEGTDYKYDVAFSFLEQDESVAIQINDLLQERLSTFIYIERQEEIAGTDGEKTLNEVFGKQSRIVVVFYRKNWGAMSWTQIEQTAIRNRAFDEGYDFVLFIPMESSQKVPKWLPKTQIWIGLERWGITGATSVIEARVQKAGGTPREETAVERAKRKKRDIERMEARNKFLKSESGVETAQEEVNKLFLEVQKIWDTVAQETGWTFDQLEPKNSLILFSSGITLALGLGLRWSNTLDDSQLCVRTWLGKQHFPNRFWPGQKPVILDELLFSFDTPDTIKFGWRESETSERFLTSKQLAELSVKLFVDAIHQQHKKKYE